MIIPVVQLTINQYTLIYFMADLVCNEKKNSDFSIHCTKQQLFVVGRYLFKFTFMFGGQFQFKSVHASIQ